MELLACFGICYGTNYIYHHKISSSNYSKKIRINSELSPLREELGSLIGERILKQNKYNRMKILEFEIIKKDLIIKYPDISIIELEKLANNIVSIKYEDSLYELDMKFKNIKDKIKIFNDELNKIEEIEMLEEIKNDKQIQMFNNDKKSNNDNCMF
tara:strand:- start:274 stop:741 length:468 start_codon:yes stop_codon:yes gene_type:complete